MEIYTLMSCKNQIEISSRKKWMLVGEFENFHEKN